MEPEIIRVTADIDELVAKIEEVKKQFGLAEKSADETGKTTEKASKTAVKSLNEVTAALKREEAEQKRLTALIREQEKITSQFRQELIRLTGEYNAAGKSGTMAGLSIKKQMDSLNLSIKDQVEGVKTLKIEQNKQKDTIKDLKNQEVQLKRNEKQTGSLGNAFNSLATKIAAAFAIERIGSFIAESVRLADTYQGVEIAFNRLGLELSELRDATQGTVSDLQLMRAAVNARNLGVPISEMSGLLEFAALRARETGESVDSLVSSIVTGLGRKSTLVLDNLGISAVDLRAALGDVSLEQANVAQLTAALNVVIEKQGGVLDENVSKLNQTSVAIENLKTKIGIELLPTIEAGSEIYKDWLGNLNDILTAMNSLNTNPFLLILDDWAASLGVVDKSLIETTRSINTWSESAREAISQGNLSGAIDDINFLKDMRDEFEGQETVLKFLNAQIINLERSLAGAAFAGKSVEEEVKTAVEKTTEAYKLKNEVAKDALMSDRSILREELDAFDAREESVDDFYQKQLDALIKSNEKKRQVDRDYADYQEGLAQEQSLALIEAAGNTFAAISTLAGENAEAQKALAIFQAIINAYLSITNVLKTVPPPAGPILATSIGALAFAQVAKIQAEPVPKFYTGTDYVALNGNKSGKDTIPAMLHEGEGVVTSQANAKWRGVVKSLNAGKFDQYMTAKHVEPALKALRKEKDMEKAALLKAAISGSVNAKLDDVKILNALRRQTRLTEELVLQGMMKKRNPYRA